ncbi:MAG: HlyD family type I secretion periplasmic adaptor subunit, partial [Pseudaminobacter sp.]|nr:HlyD family type I secretion periplasmic adaptor subunit [Pseudaminobacter sp.]
MDGIRGNLLLGLAVTVVLLGGIGAWAATTTLAGAVIATGTVVVQSSVKRVQHQTGGIVGEILVQEGEQVEATQIVIRLDETSTRANRQIVSNELDRVLARRARLEAELLGKPEMKLPELLKRRMNDPKVMAFVAGELALLESRLNAVAGKKAQAAKRIDQFSLQI